MFLIAHRAPQISVNAGARHSGITIVHCLSFFCVQLLNMLIDQQRQLVGDMLLMIDLLKHMPVFFFFEQFDPCIFFYAGGCAGHRHSRYDLAEERTLQPFSGNRAAKFHCQVAAVIHQAAPKLASFPPAVVSCIGGTKYQQHGDSKPKQCMHDWDVRAALSDNYDVVQLQPGNQPGIDTNTGRWSSGRADKYLFYEPMEGKVNQSLGL